MAQIASGQAKLATSLRCAASYCLRRWQQAVKHPLLLFALIVPWITHYERVYLSVLGFFQASKRPKYVALSKKDEFSRITDGGLQTSKCCSITQTNYVFCKNGALAEACALKQEQTNLLCNFFLRLLHGRQFLSIGQVVNRNSQEDVQERVWCFVF